MTPNQLRWSPFPFPAPSQKIDWVRSLFTICGSGRCERGHGQAWVRADGAGPRTCTESVRSGVTLGDRQTRALEEVGQVRGLEGDHRLVAAAAPPAERALPCPCSAPTPLLQRRPQRGPHHAPSLHPSLHRSAAHKEGFAIHVYAASENMVDSCLANADGDFLIVPQEGGRRRGKGAWAVLSR